MIYEFDSEKFFFITQLPVTTPRTKSPGLFVRTSLLGFGQNLYSFQTQHLFIYRYLRAEWEARVKAHCILPKQTNGPAKPQLM